MRLPLSEAVSGRSRSTAYVRLRRRLLTALLLYVGAILSSTLILIVFEGWSLIDSFYMSILTLTTVGYGEVRPLTDTGKILMSFVMILDISIFLYAVGILASAVIEGYARGIFKENRLMKRMEKFENHCIVVGYGRLGQQTSQTLSVMRQPVVAIDIKGHDAEISEDGGVLILSGDGREEEILKKAGIERARGLAACLPDESDNLVVIITAREFNPRLHIVSRASNLNYGPRLSRAGAEEVVIPEMVAGKQIAYDLIDPDKRKISRIIELPMTTRFVMDEVTLTAGSELLGKSILEAQIRQKWGVFIPFIGSEGEDYEPHPDPNRVLRKNDHLWLFGPPEKISRFIREAT